jgi:hypothetical protein
MRCPRVGNITFFPARASDAYALDCGMYAVPGQRLRKVGSRTIHEQLFWTLAEVKDYSERVGLPVTWAHEPLWH